MVKVVAYHPKLLISKKDGSTAAAIILDMVDWYSDLEIIGLLAAVFPAARMLGDLVGGIRNTVVRTPEILSARIEVVPWTAGAYGWDDPI